MFTGIVEEVGSIKRIQKISSQSMELEIMAETVLEDIEMGDSIAVNGICLTVTTFSKNSFSVDVMPETIKATSLNGLKTHSPVNLERAMAANGRFGGHFVTGHIDTTGTIIKKEAQDNAVYYEIEVPRHLEDYFIEKGSIAIDGISLTIFKIGATSILLSIIPHTVSETILGAKGTGDIVNIECDMLLKHVHHLMKLGPVAHSDQLNERFLINNGFM